MSGELFTALPPAECLDRAEAYMLSKDGAARIKERTETEVAFEYRPPFTGGESCMILLVTLLTFGVALLYLAFRIWFRKEVRLIARPTSDGRTRLLVDGKTEGLRDELREWAERELATLGSRGELPGG